MIFLRQNWIGGCDITNRFASVPTNDPITECFKDLSRELGGELVISHCQGPGDLYLQVEQQSRCLENN
jgi:hypothetical protein